MMKKMCLPLFDTKGRTPSHMPLAKACETAVVTKKLGDRLASNLHSLTGNGGLRVIIMVGESGKWLMLA